MASSASELKAGPAEKVDEAVLGPTVLLENQTLIAAPALGLTAYLADTPLWARSGAKKALELFLSVVPRDTLTSFTTSASTHWAPLGKSAKALDPASLGAWTPLGSPLRNHFFLRLADIPNVPQIGFSYTEIDPRLAARSGVIELTLPLSAPPIDLLRLATGLATIGSLDTLVGGYVARWNTVEVTAAFTQVHRWARRFRGLDIQDPDEMGWYTSRALPGTNWLTLIGDGPARAREFDVTSLSQRRWEEGVIVRTTPTGPLLQAGLSPTVGDMNALQFATAYSEVARELEPLIVKSPPLFWGPFRPKPEPTYKWMRRLIDVTEWP
jgi:hypothetical protein